MLSYTITTILCNLFFVASVNPDSCANLGNNLEKTVKIDIYPLTLLHLISAIYVKICAEFIVRTINSDKP